MLEERGNQKTGKIDFKLLESRKSIDSVRLSVNPTSSSSSNVNFSWRVHLFLSVSPPIIIIIVCVVSSPHQVEVEFNERKKNFFYDSRDLKFYVQMGASLSHSAPSWKGSKMPDIIASHSFLLFAQFIKSNYFFAIKKSPLSQEHDLLTLVWAGAGIVCELKFNCGKCLQSAMAFFNKFYNCTRLHSASSLMQAQSLNVENSESINKSRKRETTWRQATAAAHSADDKK